MTTFQESRIDFLVDAEVTGIWGVKHPPGLFRTTVELVVIYFSRCTVILESQAFKSITPTVKAEYFATDTTAPPWVHREFLCTNEGLCVGGQTRSPLIGKLEPGLLTTGPDGSGMVMIAPTNL